MYIPFSQMTRKHLLPANLVYFAKCGVNNIPKTGPIIFASNHSSFYDPPVIGIKSPRPIHYLARDTLFKGFFGECLRAIGTVPIARGTADVTSIKAILKVLKQGEATAVSAGEGVSRRAKSLAPHRQRIAYSLRPVCFSGSSRSQTRVS